MTFDTLNRLTFRAERRLTSLACFASNAVLDQEKGMHLSQVGGAFKGKGQNDV